jgi:hypothetical protein
MKTLLALLLLPLIFMLAVMCEWVDPMTDRDQWKLR